MPRYKNQRELDELMEDDLQTADAALEKKDERDAQKPVDWEKRYGDLRKYQSQKEVESQNEIANLRRQLDGMKNGTLKPPKTREEIDEYKAQYPEFSEVLESWINEAVDTRTTDLRRQSNEIKKEKALLELKRKHPDADSIFEDSKFHEWLAEQSEAEKKFIYNSFDVKNASFVLEKYKLEHGIRKDVVEDDDFDPRDAARSVKTRTRGDDVDVRRDGYLYSESQIEEMSNKDPKWWDANEEKIFDAQRKGKILMDVTGGAR